MTLILASTSPARRAMLKAVGIEFEAIAPNVDEESAKAALGGLDARALADALAELKALRVSQRYPGRLVIGSDQVLALDDGTMLDKPGDALGEHLRKLSGRTHWLISAAVAAEDGRPVWRAIEVAKLTMRSLSENFIANYVATEGEQAKKCVGGYRIEGPGAQMFSKIEGSHFAILGLPLLSLLDWLRLRGILRV